jgi:polar amino acid transport system permease protein
MMARASFAAARTHEHLALFGTTGVIYLLLTLAILRLLKLLELRMHVPGYAVPGQAAGAWGG